MSYNNAKVNPFYIQDDEEDPWDDDDDYDDEQVMLMSGSGGIKNRKYNDSRALESSNCQQHNNNNNYGNNSHYSRSYHNGQYEMQDRHSEHRPQLWKYGFLLVTILGVIVFGMFSSDGDGKRTNNNVSLSSLIDENLNKNFPNDEYRIVVLGERHSGTAWMRERLRECFPHVEVSNHLERMGYFFQDDEETSRQKAQESEKLATIHNTNATTIVVHVTLNVYDWLEQMRLSPEYAPDHAGKHKELDHPVPLGWEEFLTKPWTTERPDSDFKLVNETGPVCQMGFGYHEVVSCSKSAEGIGDPMYELQNGTAFGSIMDLRTAKLQNHHGVLESWPSVKKMIQVSYENTAQDFKSKLLHEILEFTGWEGDLPCISQSALPPSLDRSKEMSVEFVDFVGKHADWETEERVASYRKWTEEDIASKTIHSETTPKSGDQENNSEGTTSSKAKEETETDSSPEQTSTTNEELEEQPDTSAEEESKETEAKAEKDPESSSFSTTDSSSSQTDEKPAASDVVDDNSQSTSEEKKDDSSTTGSSSSEQKPVIETTVEESPSPPAPHEASNEEKIESSKATEGESPLHSDESSAQDESEKGTDDSMKDLTDTTSDEKEEEKSPSTKDVDEGDASSGEKDDTAADGSKSEATGGEINEKEVSPDDKSKPNEESPTAEKIEEKSPSESTSEEETEVEKDEASADEKKEENKEEGKAPDNEKEKEIDESKSESETETTKSEERDHAEDETNEDGGEQ